MRVFALAVVLVAACVALPTVGEAQTLGELAAKEKERRKGQKPAKTYQDSDLGRSGKGTVSVMGAEPSTTTEATPATDETTSKDKEKSADEKRDEEQKAWRERLKKANEEVDRLKQEVDRLQTSLNDTTNNVYSEQRARLMEQLAARRKKLEDAQAAVAALEEERRRKGFR